MASYEEWKALGRPGGSFASWQAQQDGGGQEAPSPAQVYRPTQKASPAPTQSGGGLGDLSGFKSYEQWQAANRAAGGSGSSAQVKSYFGGGQTSGQPDYLAQTGGQQTSGGGTTPYTGPADTTKWRTDVPMADSVHPDASSKSGDPFVDMVRASGTGSEDYARFSNAQILAWKDKYDPAASAQAGIPKFKNDFGDIVDKPTESGQLSKAAGYATGERSAGTRGGGGGGRGGGGGGGAAGGGSGTAGGVPQFNYTAFQAPSYESAMSDPGYQFALKEGANQLQGSAAAKGILRTSGTLKDLINYGQQAAAQQYGDVYDRALSTWGAQYQGEKDAFAPQYGGWQTQYAGDLSKWTTNQNNDLSRWQTQYGGDLSKYLNRENNIYGALNQPAPTYPSYA